MMNRTVERARFVTDAILRNAEPWTGPVVRRDPAAYRQRSQILTWRCENIGCRHWTPKGSRAAGRCLLCHTPKPDSA
jgi:hypothetical protein